MSIRLLGCSGSLEGGGSERQLWQLATGIDSRQFSPQLYLLRRCGTYVAQTPSRIPIHDFESVQPEKGLLQWPGKLHRAQVAHLSSLIRQQKIDIVYDRTFHMTLVTGPACRATRTPRVSVIVSPPSRDFPHSRERFAWLKKRLLRWAYCDPLGKTVAVSKSVAEDACHFYGLPPGRIESVASPIDIGQVEQAAQTEWQPEDAAESRMCVVGRLSEEKGQRVAIAAFAKAVASEPSRRWCLDVVGDGPDRERLQALARTLGVEAQVRFHGFVANPYPIIKAAGLLVIPSEYEGLPNVALEAMVLRTPILATDCSGTLSELLGGDQRGLIVPVGDEERMAHAMQRRVEQEDVWRQRSQDAYQRVCREHALPAWLEKMEELLADWCSRAPRGLRP